MEELLPGLVRVMEERLGRFGRPLTTVMVICLALGASAWGIKLFVDNAISPLVQFIQGILLAQELSLGLIRRIAITVGAYVVVFSSLFFIFRAIYKRKIFAPAERLLGQLHDTQRETEKIAETAKMALKEAKELCGEVQQVVKAELESDSEDSQP